MTETIVYIKNSLKDLYSPSEVNGMVRLIMEKVCHIPPHHYLTGRDTVVPENEKKRIKKITEHLRRMEPIQYILGIADFYSLEFEVDSSVLIPRPETEELVDLIIREHAGTKMNILDIGTGSGCIAITLARHLKEAKVTAIDISTEALGIAERNALKNNTPVTFIHTDILTPEKAGADIPGPFDLIVSNPPYIKELEKKEMETNVLGYEPHLALFVPDDDPLLFYRNIARFGKRKLKKGGWLYFEINALHGRDTAGMLQGEGYENIELIRDLSGKDRIIKARS